MGGTGWPARWPGKGWGVASRASNLADFGTVRRGRASAWAGAVPACPRPGVYVPRQTHDCDAAVLVRRHLPGFLAIASREGGHGLPEFGATNWTLKFGEVQ
jgi:hypothetical protein